MRSENGKRGREPDANASLMDAGSSLGPFHHSTFTVLWVATVVSNVGTWMQNAAAGWLMTGLNPDPLVVALVQVATLLPMFLLSIPAGAMADILDRRRLLIVVQTAAAIIVAILGLLIWSDVVTPLILLGFTFLAGCTAALIAPAWQAIVPQLVSSRDLAAAVTLNGIGINISRAVGPALAGLIIATIGLSGPFWLNAISYLGVIAALIWWRKHSKSASNLPAERFVAAIRIGLRHSRHNSHLRATLIRTIGFFPFASAYWALLPLVARTQVAGGPELYGILLGMIGAGCIGGGFAMPWLKIHLGPDRLVAVGTTGTAAALILFGLARHPAVAITASLIAGVSWISVVATINFSAQVALPEWVRGRGLAMFASVMFGSMSIGSYLWGQLAGMMGLPKTHFIAAALALAVIPLIWRWKLQTGANVDLMPSLHWPTPILVYGTNADHKPALVTVEYLIESRNHDAFIAAIERLSHQRRRDGAYAWGVYQDTSERGRFLETFMSDSWLEHLRQHERVTHADQALQNEVNLFHLHGKPKVMHFVSAAPRRPGQQKEK